MGGAFLVGQWLRLHFHSRGHGFNPWSGNSDVTCRVERPTKKKRNVLSPSVCLPRKKKTASGNPAKNILIVNGDESDTTKVS